MHAARINGRVCCCGAAPLACAPCALRRSSAVRQPCGSRAAAVRMRDACRAVNPLATRLKAVALTRHDDDALPARAAPAAAAAAVD